MSKPDLILLHAPSVYDFRERPSLLGPVSDVVPSTQVFEMYPIGFLSILTYLQKAGFSVRIINVALRMLRSRRFDVEKLIRSLKPAAFGIDLHWLVHAQGSLELAAMIKRHHPDTPVIFGGLSASYFHKELAQCPHVDYVLRGDSTEKPLSLLLSAIRQGREPSDISGLTWQKQGQVKVNDITETLPDLDALSFDYGRMMQSCLRHRDILGHIPFASWLRYPIVAALSCRGCVHNCAICGGSASAYEITSQRKTPAYRDPTAMARDMGRVARSIRAPIMILGDILQAGKDYARTFLTALAEEKIKNHVAFEFFTPPPRYLLELAATAAPRFNLEISPESHDERVRRAFGRYYTNKALEQSIEDALELGCRRIDLFFMIGIPKQTRESVTGTVRYCGELLEKYARSEGKVRPFISPLAPFLDPGSRAFEDPREHGYRLFHRTLEEHRNALLAPSWKYTLNYETRWISRDEIVQATYDAALELNRLKRQHGLLSEKDAADIDDRIAREKQLIGQIDGICAGIPPDTDWGNLPAQTASELRALLTSYHTTGPATICKKTELDWPTAFLRFNPFRILWELLRKR